MFDQFDPQDTCLRKENWKEDVMAALAGQERMIAAALEGEPLPDRIDIELVKANRTSVTTRALLGTRTFILKLFAREGLQSELYYQREKGALMALRGRGVAPRLIGFCDQRHFLMMQAVPTLEHAQAQARLGWLGFAREIGAWLGRIDRAAPGRPAHGNWATYLSRYTDQLCLENAPVAQDILSRIPLCGQSLAQCDASLGNVIFRPDGSVVGVDFEQARFRPRGWDFAMYFISLVERMPDQAEEILAALAEGFASEHRGALLIEELCTVARLILCLRANAFVIEEDLSHGN
ncbi:aminoglycoside phosphotransferase family protein [Shimia sediminis]|uniref:aminoglycoside phosphotransferase family protein n=1 Tax=Shimia sediminis TaxID=2497945 RepID=UPI0013DF7951|nr:aminoglycoside phosphotransferase family protein [Shimia sediminis]